jgi:hypothetical protein
MSNFQVGQGTTLLNGPLQTLSSTSTRPLIVGHGSGPSNRATGLLSNPANWPALVPEIFPRHPGYVWMFSGLSNLWRTPLIPGAGSSVYDRNGTEYILSHYRNGMVSLQKLGNPGPPPVGYFQLVRGAR